MTHAVATTRPQCRFCAGLDGEIVLDLGLQPAADHFPALGDPGPDPVHPLQMWLCGACGLAQLVADPTAAEEPLATEPAALAEQARAAVGRLHADGLLAAGLRAVEFGSPHGGSWSELLLARGVTPAPHPGAADVVIDCFGMMHSADQRAALVERAGWLAPGGVLLLQYHSLATILRRGQWNSLRHGHFAYYSTTALVHMLAREGLVARAAWTFDLYGGTVLLAASAATDGPFTSGPSAEVSALLAEEERLGVADAEALRALQRDADGRAAGLRHWLVEQRRIGQRVLGYGAASRAVPLLCEAGIGRELLPAIADASRGKQGRRMPATDIPVISPEALVESRPDTVLLLLPDLLREVRSALPGVETSGGRWVDVENIEATPAHAALGGTNGQQREDGAGVV